MNRQRTLSVPRTMAFIAFLCIAFFSVFPIGCSAPVSSEIDPAVELDGGSVVQDAGAPQREIAFSLHFAPDKLVEPGAEGIHCLDLPAPLTDTYVSGWAVRKKGAHHVNVWRRKIGTPTPVYTTITPCGGSAGPGYFLLDSSQEHFEQIFPRGAYLIPGGASMIFDVHYINTTQEPIEEDVAVDFYKAEVTTPRVDTFLLYGGGGWSVAPHSSSTLTIECDALRSRVPLPILSVLGHAHAHMTELRGAIDGKVFYTDNSWSDPPIEFPKDLAIPVGGLLSVSCDVTNPTDVPITTGSHVQTNEMCDLYVLIEGQGTACHGIIK